MSTEHNLISVHMSSFHEEEVDLKKYETSFRRWLVSEIELGHMTIHQARDKFKLPHRFDVLFKQCAEKQMKLEIRKKFGPKQ